jgi:hypothetical protein
MSYWRHSKTLRHINIHLKYFSTFIYYIYSHACYSDVLISYVDGVFVLVDRNCSGCFPLARHQSVPPAKQGTVEA